MWPRDQREVLWFAKSSWSGSRPKSIQQCLPTVRIFHTRLEPMDALGWCFARTAAIERWQKIWRMMWYVEICDKIRAVMFVKKQSCAWRKDYLVTICSLIWLKIDISLMSCVYHGTCQTCAYGPALLFAGEVPVWKSLVQTESQIWMFYIWILCVRVFFASRTWTFRLVRHLSRECLSVFFSRYLQSRLREKKSAMGLLDCLAVEGLEVGPGSLVMDLKTRFLLWLRVRLGCEQRWNSQESSETQATTPGVTRKVLGSKLSVPTLTASGFAKAEKFAMVEKATPEVLKAFGSRKWWGWLMETCEVRKDERPQTFPCVNWVVISNILNFHPENWGRWTHFD